MSELIPGDPDTVVELKNLKIDPELHRRLKIQAAARGVSLQVLTDAVLAVGLRHLDDADPPAPPTAAAEG